MTTSLTIQQAAAATGLTVHTLRYYERIGLIDPIRRKDNKHRIYREEDILWIGFLLKLRSTGLPIQKMLRYAELRRLGVGEGLRESHPVAVGTLQKLSFTHEPCFLPFNGYRSLRKAVAIGL